MAFFFLPHHHAFFKQQASTQKDHPKTAKKVAPLCFSRVMLISE